MIISLFSIEKEYFRNLLFPVIILFFLYFPFVTGVNSARPDYIPYVNYFNELPVLFSEDFFKVLNEFHLELGYGIFSGLIKYIINSPTIFFIILCFLSFIFRFNSVNFFSRKEDIILVLFAFLAHEFLRKDSVQIRNGIASAIVLFSFISLYKGKQMRFCIWVIVATMFHLVSLIAIPLLIINSSVLYKKEFRIMQIFLLIAVLSTFFFSIKNVFFLLENFGIVPGRIITYLRWSQFSRPMPIYHPVVLKQVMICLFFLFVRKDILFSSNNKSVFLFKIYFISTLYYLVFLDFEILAGRFGSLFAGVETLFLLQIIHSSKIVKQKKIMKLAVFFLICSTFIINWITYSSTLSFEMTFQ
jgi:hypothetical protein